MQWDSTPNAGFTKENIKPWLKINPNYIYENVEVSI
jgi:oligo-1,6-glucosidase